MPEGLVDERFVNAFNYKFKEHLKGRDLPGNIENHPKKMVDDAIKQGTGKLSRVFDALELPVVDSQTFDKRLKEAGAMASYMKPTLVEVAKFLLNPDKTRLNDEAIEAIGKDRYAKLVGGNIDRDGSIKAGLEGEIIFIEKQKEVARTFMTAAVMAYATSLNKHALSQKDAAIQKGCDRLGVKIAAMKKDLPINAGLIDRWKKDLPEQAIDNLNERAEALCDLIDMVIENEDAEVERFKGLYQICTSLFRAGCEYLSPKKLNFATKVSVPLNMIASNFKLEQLEDQPSKALSSENVKDNILELMDFIDYARVGLKGVSGDKEYAKSINSFLDTLEKAITIHEMYEGIPEEDLKKMMLDEYSNGVDAFVARTERLINEQKPDMATAKILHIILKETLNENPLSKLEEHSVLLEKLNQLGSGKPETVEQTQPKGLSFN